MDTLKRSAALALAAAMLAAVAVACGSRQPTGEHALLRMQIDPETASVYVDDRFIASGRKLAGRPERLRPGHHFITVTAPGYFPHDVEVDLPVGETNIELSLRPVPP
jgi:hypothetical protein